MAVPADLDCDHGDARAGQFAGDCTRREPRPQGWADGGGGICVGLPVSYDAGRTRAGCGAAIVARGVPGDPVAGRGVSHLAGHPGAAQQGRRPGSCWTAGGPGPLAGVSPECLCESAQSEGDAVLRGVPAAVRRCAGRPCGAANAAAGRRVHGADHRGVQRVRLVQGPPSMSATMVSAMPTRPDSAAASRSMPVRRRPRAASQRTWRPLPQATSSTEAPAGSPAAQRTTHGEGAANVCESDATADINSPSAVRQTHRLAHLAHGLLRNLAGVVAAISNDGAQQ